MYKEFFSIGEISSLLGLSSHTLRYYDKIGLIKPAIVNEQNGYRMYSYEQLFTLERVRYLQQLGFNLDEIRDIFSDITTSTLCRYLELKKQGLDQEIDRLSAFRDVVNCSMRYYQRLNDGIAPGFPFVSQEDVRYIFTEPFVPGEPLMGTAGYRLTIRIRRPEFANLFFLRHIGYLLDYPALMEGRIVPTHYFMFLEKPPAVPIPEVITIPAGRYMSYRCHALSPEVDISPLTRMLSLKETGRIALACEFEQSLDDSVSAFEQSLFEIQVLL